MIIILAVSGGIDSMYMANRASELFPDSTFAIAHCNFCLRGEESDADEEFVRSWAKEKGFEFYNIRFNTLEYAATNKISTEMAARELRYTWFYELAQNIGAEAIAVAHNANDNAETLILNLLRGTGSKGLRGMSVIANYFPVITRSVSDEIIISVPKLLRPLLNTSRQEIYNYMISNKLSWREDRTNSENIYQRNIIRNEIFPLFAKINPSFIKTLNSDIKHFIQVDDIANSYYNNNKSQFVDNNTIIVSKLLSLKHWEYLLWKALEDSGIKSEEYNSLVVCLKSGRQYAGKRFGPVLGASGRLEILTRHCERSAAISDQNTIIANEMRQSQAININTEIIPRNEVIDLKQAKGVLLFDADKLTLPLKIRHWNKGDWFIPFGMKGKKKISDYLTDLHYSIEQKSRTLVIECPLDPTRIAAVLFSRIDDSLKVDSNTTNILRIWMSL